MLIPTKPDIEARCCRSSEMRVPRNLRSSAFICGFNQETSTRGFSIIELLTALALLVIMIGIMALIFTHADIARNRGIARIESNTGGQTALSWLTRDLESAVADTNLTFAMRQDRDALTSYGITNSEICFISLDLVPSTTNRVAREIQYWVQEMTNSAGAKLGRYELVRSCHSFPPGASEDCYLNPDWYDTYIPPDNEQGIVAENIASFQLLATGLAENYCSVSNANVLPEYVDVCLEMLDDRAAHQAVQLSGNATDFVERNVRRYTTRVYFLNRDGYLPR
jgi:hypothetical protein